jgi:opacity protein-like surface antigen
MNSSVASLPQPERKKPFLSSPNRALPHAALLLGAASFVAPASLSAFWEVARGEVILHTTGRATYDSNIYAESNAQDDIYFSFIPELQFLRQAGLGTIDARTGVDFTRFADFSGENYEDFFASLNVTYPVRSGSPLSGAFTAAYTQHSGVNEYLNSRIKEDIFSIGLNTRYRFGQRLGLRNSLSYSRNNVDIFSDVEAYSGTLGLQWAYSEALAFFTDYRLRTTRSIGEGDAARSRVDNLDNAIFFGATGRLAPRLDGTASVGYQHSNARKQGSNRTLFVTSAELAWAFLPQTDLTLGVSRDLDVSPTDQTVEASAISLGLAHRIDPKIRLDGYIGYREFSFQGGDRRSDDTFQLGAGMSYEFTRHWNAGANYDYTNNDSTRAQADYRRHVTRLYTRYSF